MKRIGPMFWEVLFMLWASSLGLVGCASTTVSRVGIKDDPGADASAVLRDAGAEANRSDSAKSPPSSTCDWMGPVGVLCSKQIGDWTGDAGSSLPIVGAVTDLLPGSPSCVNDLLAQSTRWSFRVWDGRRGIELGLPTPFPIVNVGDVLSVNSQYRMSPFAPTDGYTEVRTSDGKLLFWSGVSGSTTTLRTPREVSVADGALICEGSDDCGTWEDRKIKISGAGQAVELGPGEVAQIGEYSVTSGVTAEQTSTISRCSDWYVAVASAWAVRGTPATLAQKPKCGGVDCSAIEYCEPASGSGCFSAASSGSCLRKPDSCWTDCPGVCGCDGAFYCSDCAAHLKGVSVAQGSTDCYATAPRCPGGGTGMSEVWCEYAWQCKEVGYASDYTIACAAGDSGTIWCDCQENGKTVRKVTVPSIFVSAFCGSASFLEACGFPSAINGP